MLTALRRFHYKAIGVLLLLILSTGVGPAAPEAFAQSLRCEATFKTYSSSTSKTRSESATKTTAALKVDSLSRIELADENYDRNCLVESYFCSFAERTHYRTAISPLSNGYVTNARQKYVGRTSIIQVEGVGVIGLLKNEGDRTFLALADVVDTRGNRILVQGYMYRPTNALADAIETTWDQNPNQRFPSFILKSITLLPERIFKASRVTETHSFIESLKIRFKKRKTPLLGRPLTAENLNERLNEVLESAERLAIKPIPLSN